MEHILEIRKRKLELRLDSDTKHKAKMLPVNQFSENTEDMVDVFVIKTAEENPTEEEIEYFFCQLIDQKIITPNQEIKTEDYSLNITVASAENYEHINAGFCSIPVEESFTVYIECQVEHVWYLDLFIISTILSKKKIYFDSTLPKEHLLTSSVSFSRDYYKDE